MRKIYVLGAGSVLEAIEKAKKILEIKKDSGIEVICVDSKEDVPMRDSISSTIPLIEITKLQCYPKEYTNCYIDKKRKSHERSYKYHK